MKKFIFIILFILLISFPVHAKSYVYDSAYALSNDAKLEKKCKDYKREYGVAVFIVTDDEEFNKYNDLSTVGKYSIGPTVVFLINVEGYIDCQVYNGNRYLKSSLFSYPITFGYTENYDNGAMFILNSAESVLANYKEKTTHKSPMASVVFDICIFISFIIALAMAGSHIKRLKKQLITMSVPTDNTQYINRDR